MSDSMRGDRDSNLWQAWPWGNGMKGIYSIKHITYYSMKQGTSIKISHANVMDI